MRLVVSCHFQQQVLNAHRINQIPLIINEVFMKCKQCGHKLEVARQCRQVRLKCSGCSHEYQIHEVAADLDRETEEILERYTCLVYD